MRVLFIGGTGIISTACTELAAARGIELTLLNRGKRLVKTPPDVQVLNADIEDTVAAASALRGMSFDAVVDWVAYAPAHVERDVKLFRGRAAQYVFISSASVYQRPVSHYLITESTPLANPFWKYSRDKIECEEVLMRAYREEGFPFTVVRPSLTYGDSQIPLAINSWHKSYTVVDRMRRGKKVIVPGDGSSLWVTTHNTDFARGFIGLLGHRQAIGHAFHITTDEVLCWDQYYKLTAEAAGVEAKLVHVPSSFIAACMPDELGNLTGDKSPSVVFDNSKIKRFVPEFRATVTFAEGIRRTLAWFDADPQRQQTDEEANSAYDKLIDAYECATVAAIKRFHA
jgi:nucleoside-diphosphate-sugar epimerase